MRSRNEDVSGSSMRTWKPLEAIQTSLDHKGMITWFVVRGVVVLMTKESAKIYNNLKPTPSIPKLM